jgi:outer membrane lipoprotein carrier protein
MRAFCLLVCLCVCLSARAASDPLHEFMSGVRTLQADFEQVVLDEQGKELERSAGTLALQRPGRFRWSYQTPYAQEIVGDGEQVWVYDQDLAQVTVRPAGQALGSTPAVLLSTDRRIEDEFEVTDHGDQGGTRWFDLVPRRGEGGFSRIRLGFSDSEMRLMELKDGFGQTTLLRFVGVRRNQPVAAELFRFEPPPGVDVVRDAPRPRAAPVDP